MIWIPRKLLNAPLMLSMAMICWDSALRSNSQTKRLPSSTHSPSTRGTKVSIQEKTMEASVAGTEEIITTTTGEEVVDLAAVAALTRELTGVTLTTMTGTMTGDTITEQLGNTMIMTNTMMRMATTTRTIGVAATGDMGRKSTTREAVMIGGAVTTTVEKVEEDEEVTTIGAEIAGGETAATTREREAETKGVTKTILKPRMRRECSTSTT